MIPDIAIRAEAMFDESNAYCVNTAYIIPSNDLGLLGILNSRLIQFFYMNLTTSIRGGYLRFIRQYLAQIPIPIHSDKLMPVRVKVEEIIQEKNGNPNFDTKDLENQIDRLVYQLFELSENEIGLIKENLKGNKSSS